ncbi:two-component sensor histidine kinase [Flavimobilis marinus]|uniref:histidine kinase n=1 Tax=Flavimobilis marinus TaxID=285351 RepID=A0A1I2D345_9MICO|nr:HAMP domain-containing sensor histidine kinase [Flavimobilis marinus]GHG46213.1 two-component sensor histidine kinase [Flavimobilis marinus]SFE74931.1 Signal transduction histidine kinase [Flavimobilis marinus]
MTTPAARDRSRPVGSGSRLGVRARVLLVVVSLSALGLLLAGLLAFVAQSRAVDAQIDQALNQTVSEFQQLAAEGTDPETGTSFTDARTLIYATMQLSIPTTNEGMIGIIGDRIALTAPPAVQLRLEDDPELVAALAGASQGERIVLRTLTTAQRTYRFAVIPVHVERGGADGALVTGFDQDAEHARFNQVFRVYAYVALGAIAVVALAGAWISSRALRPITALRETAQVITESDLSRRIAVTGNDDLSELARTVNAMLDRLEDAFVSQRQLLDDVGHELRTPVTIVRGHLELMDPDDPDDARTTRDIAMGELLRMQRLVDDLMTLATVAHPDFVRPTPTDVGRLTDDVLDVLRPLAPRRWVVDARATSTLLVDAQRITQALVQLAANAVRYSAEGSTIAVGSAVQDGRLRFWVRDEGVGIASDEVPRVFERFVRGDRGRGTHDGAGLGLAIVTAIAQAHGGRAWVESVQGVGSTFTIDLPAATRPAPLPQAGPADGEHSGTEHDAGEERNEQWPRS